MARRAWSMILPCLLLSACSYEYRIVGEVRVAEGVELPEEAAVYLVFGDPNAGSDQILLEAGTGDDARVFRGEGVHCCNPQPRLEFYAFVDLDGDGSWGEGEPRGDDPNGEVKLDSPTYRSRIEIE